METTISCVQDTGVKRVETFTIRLSVPKSKLQEQFDEDSLSFSEPVTFNRGLLQGIPNTFELKIKEMALSDVFIYFPAEIGRRGPSGVRVTGIKLTLLEDGVECHSGDMRHYWGSYVSESGQRCFLTKGPLTGFTNLYKYDGNVNHKWTDTVNELRFDITVVQISKLEFKLSEIVRVSPKPEMVPKSMDLSKYFMSSQFSDASIKCEEETFPVHLILLAERSPVFAKMFEHNMKEAESRCVEIKDTQAVAVREMLRYFYTQTVNDLDVVGLELYELADKYLVEDLKTLCTNFLASNVNTENVVELYCFGRKHEDQIIVDAAEDFLSTNVKISVKNLHELQTFLKDVPALLSDDIFRLLWSY